MPLVTENELCGCHLVLRTSKSTGARGDVQNFGGCALTQALESMTFLFDVHCASINSNRELTLNYVDTGQESLKILASEKTCITYS